MSGLDVVQVSDIHLSESHAWFQDNWEVFVATMQLDPPALILVTGDVCVNGPARFEDMAFARKQLDRLPCRWLVIPGNHDSGETPPDERNDEPLTDKRRAAFLKHLGPDFWAEDVGGWRFIGLNAQLFDSSLSAEAEQWRFLEDALSETGNPIAVSIHKPLYLKDPASKRQTLTCIYPESRKRLLNLFEAAGVKLVTSGHLHRYRRMRHGAMRLIWAPATSFLMTGRKGLPGVARLGYLRYRFGPRSFTCKFVEPPMFVQLDVRNWNRYRGSTIHLPQKAWRPGPHDFPAEALGRKPEEGWSVKAPL